MKNENSTEQKKKERALADLVYALARIRRIFGTITDLGLFARLEGDEILNGPAIGLEAVETAKLAAQERLVFTNQKEPPIDFNKDGKRLVAFTTLYRNVYKDYLTGIVEDSEKEMHRLLVRFNLRNLITAGEQEAKRRCVDFINYEFTEEDVQYIREIGAAIILRPEHQKEIQTETKEMARAFIDAKNNAVRHLADVWLELFKERGVQAAKEWMRERWTPINDDARNVINSAYTLAKSEFKP